MPNPLINIPKTVFKASKKVLEMPQKAISLPKHLFELGKDVFEHPEKMAETSKLLFSLPTRVINKVIKAYLIMYTSTRKADFSTQEKILFPLIHKCRHTLFGRKYAFEHIKTIKDFQRQVPISHYKDFEYLITYMLKGESDITYPGKIDWFATSSGTTGGTAKYIPVTKDCLKESHFKGGIDMVSYFVKSNPRTQFLNGKGLAIGGSFTKNPYTGEDNVGFISAILQKNAPRIGQHYREPSSEITYIENREEKVEKILETTVDKNIVSLSGQPSWGSNFLYKVLEHTKKKNILEVRPNFEFFFWGGMAMDLYKPQYAALFPSSKVKYYQIYNASEGCFAVQDYNFADDMLLLVEHGVFYEFIPTEEYGKKDPKVLTLKEVELGKDYVIVITNNSGLWRYILGDTVQFTSLKPWRIKITGRTKYYIDVVGECVTSDYTDKALMEVCKKTNTISVNYMVAPKMYSGGSIRGAYEWIIECAQIPEDQNAFAHLLDQQLAEMHPYYYDERFDAKDLGEPIVHCVPEGTFYEWLKSKNKLGGQFKVPKVSNERTHIDEVLAML